MTRDSLRHGLWVAVLLAGCDAYDPRLLEPFDGAARRDGGPPTSMDSGSPPAEGGADGGVDSGPPRDGSPDSDAGAVCEENPGDESCPLRCPERCNELDDDCDEVIDEDGACTSDCESVSGETREYFVCPSRIGWQSAALSCSELDGLLAGVETLAEDELLADQLDGPSWIGHNQLRREGVWTWLHNGVPFWRNDGVGVAIADRYSNWAAGSPSGAGDCGALNPWGEFEDRDCSDRLPFVCEVAPDGCANNPDKDDPGQCGCDMPDIDEDSDVFAACVDSCDDDPDKLLPGDCGCGVPDVDANEDGEPDCADQCPDDPDKNVEGVCGCGVPDDDGDGDYSPDCIDRCPMDPAKTMAGTCGCGVSDADDDGDGTPNCNDLCPADPAKTDDGDSDGDGAIDCADGCPFDTTRTGDCFPFTVSNIDPRRLDFDGAPDAQLDGCGNNITTITTSSSGASFDNWCGTSGTPTPVVQSQSGGPDVVVLPLSGLNVAAGHTLRLRGTQPVVFAVAGDVMIAGTLTASALGTQAGAGGDSAQCGASTGGPGDGLAGVNGSGGGGGGFGTAGGVGGDYLGLAFGTAGIERGSAELSPLLGGCPGGLGGGCLAAAGAGAGAVQITARGALTVEGTIRANGGEGGNATCIDGGGGGGGSGGGILLESNTRAVSGIIEANGGDGGNGQDNASPGSGSTSSGATGGAGVAATFDSGGSGGGGGYGRIHTR